MAAHLETEHGGPFFFDVGSLREGRGTALIELSEVFRQRDQALIDVLNKVRDGEAGEDDLALLNERVHPIRTLSEGEPYVILVPTNAAAKRINDAYLAALDGRRGDLPGERDRRVQRQRPADRRHPGAEARAPR